MSKTRLTFLTRPFFLVAAFCVLASSNLSAQVTGVWEMNTGQQFTLVEYNGGEGVTGFFSGYNFGPTFVVGDKTADGVIQLHGVSVDALYQIELVHDAETNTLQGDVTKRPFFGRERQFSFTAEQPYEAGSSSLDGAWILKSRNDQRQYAMAIVTVEIWGTMNHFAIEFSVAPESDIPLNIVDIYRGRVFSDNRFYLRGRNGAIFGRNQGNVIEVGRLTFNSFEVLDGERNVVD